MALFNLVDSCQHSGGTWYLHLLERNGSFAGKKWKVWINIQRDMKNGCWFPLVLHKVASVMTASSYSVYPPFILPVHFLFYVSSFL